MKFPAGNGSQYSMNVKALSVIASLQAKCAKWSLRSRKLGDQHAFPHYLLAPLAHRMLINRESGCEIFNLFRTRNMWILPMWTKTCSVPSVFFSSSFSRGSLEILLYLKISSIIKQIFKRDILHIFLLYIYFFVLSRRYIFYVSSLWRVLLLCLRFIN